MEPENKVFVNDILPLSRELDTFVNGHAIRFLPGILFDLSATEIGLFDLVLCCEIIEHIAHGDQFITKIRTLLSPNGILLLTTPNGSYFRSRKPTHSQISDFTRLESEQFKPDSDGHLYFYTPEEIAELLTASSFRDVHVQLHITPWLSGHVMLRWLPKLRFLFPLYYLLDFLFKKLGPRFRAISCTQMIVTARLRP